VELQEEFQTMTTKGITRTCFGSVFNDEDEIRKMTHIYNQVSLAVLHNANFYAWNATTIFNFWHNYVFSIKLYFEKQLQYLQYLL